MRRSPIAGPGGRKKARADARSASKQHPASFKRQDCTLMAWYRYVYAPRTGGAYDSPHRTAGIASRTRRSGRVAAPGARAAAGDEKAGITFAYYDVVSLLCHGVIQLS